MKKLPFVILLAAVVGFIFGLVHLFNLRFEAGDVYPQYSSLRADPLGAKGLYESLSQLLRARRHFQSLSKLEDGRDTTLFYLGESADGLSFEPSQFKELDAFLGGGGRLVISFLPVHLRPGTNRFLALSMPPSGKPPSGGVPPASPPSRKSGADPKDPPAGPHAISITERWGLNYGYAPLPKDDNDAYQPAPAFRQGEGALPTTIPCHTALCFTNLDPAWRVLYARTNNRPVVIERKWGDGTIVLSADSFHFSNEALRDDRQPALLAWFTGAGGRVVFDETHLGTREDPGIAVLARKYRLHGFFAALLVLTGLFVWKNSMSFLPPYEDQAGHGREAFIAGKDSAAGFVNLLRRNIPRSELLKVCLEQWSGHFLHARTPSRWKLEAMQKIIDAENALAPRQRNPVRTYQQFCKILSRRSPIQGPGSLTSTSDNNQKETYGAEPGMS